MSSLLLTPPNPRIGLVVHIAFHDGASAYDDSYTMTVKDCVGNTLFDGPVYDERTIHKYQQFYGQSPDLTTSLTTEDA